MPGKSNVGWHAMFGGAKRLVAQLEKKCSSILIQGFWMILKHWQHDLKKLFLFQTFIVHYFVFTFYNYILQHTLQILFSHIFSKRSHLGFTHLQTLLALGGVGVPLRVRQRMTEREPLCPPTRPNIHFSQSLEYFCLALTQTGRYFHPSWTLRGVGSFYRLVNCPAVDEIFRDWPIKTLPNRNQQYQVNSLPSFHERVVMSHAI